MGWMDNLHHPRRSRDMGEKMMTVCDAMLLFVMVASSGAGWLVGWLCGHKWTVKQYRLKQRVEELEGK